MGIRDFLHRYFRFAFVLILAVPFSYMFGILFWGLLGNSNGDIGMFQALLLLIPFFLIAFGICLNLVNFLLLEDTEHTGVALRIGIGIGLPLIAWRLWIIRSDFSSAGWMLAFILIGVIAVSMSIGRLWVLFRHGR